MKFFKTNEGQSCKKNIEAKFRIALEIENEEEIKIDYNLSSGDGNLRIDLIEEFIVCKYESINSIQGYKSLEEIVYQRGDKILSPKIKFSYHGGVYILEESNSSVELLAEFIKKHSNLELEIGIHLDIRGSEDFLKELSTFRGRNLGNTLNRRFNLEEGSNFKLIGYGKEEPIISKEEIDLINNKELKSKLHWINERIEIKVLEVR